LTANADSNSSRRAASNDPTFTHPTVTDRVALGDVNSEGAGKTQFVGEKNLKVVTTFSLRILQLLNKANLLDGINRILRFAI